MVRFCSDKLTGLGFKFKYGLEEMLRGAIETCREKGMLPYSTQKHSNGENNGFTPDTKNKQKSLGQEQESILTSDEKHKKGENAQLLDIEEKHTNEKF